MSRSLIKLEAVVAATLSNLEGISPRATEILISLKGDVNTQVAMSLAHTSGILGRAV